MRFNSVYLDRNGLGGGGTLMDLLWNPGRCCLFLGNLLLGFIPRKVVRDVRPTVGLF